MKPANKVSYDLFQLLRSRFPSVKLGGEDTNVVSDPNDAKFFSFIYKEGDTNVGPVSISIADNRALKVYYTDGMVNQLKFTRPWYELLRTLRLFARSNMMGFDARDISKSQLDPRDFEFIGIMDSPYKEKDVEISESAMTGSTKKSYQQIGNVQLLVNHSSEINPDVRGARSRRIDSIFVERNDGERYRLPFRHLSGARSLAMHISNGGTPYDTIGEHIVNTVKEMQDLGRFCRMTKKVALENQDAGSTRERVVKKYHKMREHIGKLQNESYYHQFVEDYSPFESAGYTDEDVENLRNTFTRRVQNEKIENLLPTVLRILGEDPEEETVQEVQGTPKNYKTGITPLVRSISFNDLEPEFSGQQDYETVKKIKWPYGVKVKFDDQNREVTFKTAKMKTVAKILSKHIDFGAVSAGEILDLPPGLMFSEEKLEEDATGMQGIVSNPNFRLILRDDKEADRMVANMKFETSTGLLQYVLSDIASRAVGPESDTISTFASSVSDQLSQEDQGMQVADPAFVENKAIATQLAKQYVNDIRHMKYDKNYASMVRQVPEEEQQAAPAKGLDSQFESWVDETIEDNTQLGEGLPAVLGRVAAGYAIDKGAKALKKRINSIVGDDEEDEIEEAVPQGTVGTVGTDGTSDSTSPQEAQDAQRAAKNISRVAQAAGVQANSNQIAQAIIASQRGQPMNGAAAQVFQQIGDVVTQQASENPRKAAGMAAMLQRFTQQESREQRAMLIKEFADYEKIMEKPAIRPNGDSPLTANQRRQEMDFQTGKRPHGPSAGPDQVLKPTDWGTSNTPIPTNPKVGAQAAPITPGSVSVNDIGKTPSNTRAAVTPVTQLDPRAKSPMSGTNPRAQKAATDRYNGMAQAAQDAEDAARYNPAKSMNVLDPAEKKLGSNGTPPAGAMPQVTPPRSRTTPKVDRPTAAPSQAAAASPAPQDTGRGPTDIGTIKNAPFTTNTFKPGDTLGKIAQKAGVTVDDIMKANPQIKNPNKIAAGAEYKMPTTPSSNYVIKKGDTLGGIAKKWGTSLDKLMKANGIKDPNKIYAGYGLKRPMESVKDEGEVVNEQYKISVNEDQIEYFESEGDARSAYQRFVEECGKENVRVSKITRRLASEKKLNVSDENCDTIEPLPDDQALVPDEGTGEDEDLQTLKKLSGI